MFDLDDVTDDEFGNFESLGQALMSSEYGTSFNVGSSDELLELLFFTPVVLSLNTNDDGDCTINGHTVQPTVAWLLDRLNDDVDCSEHKQELKSTIAQALLDQLKEGSDLRNTLCIRSKSNRNI